MAKDVPLSKVLWVLAAIVIGVLVFRACYSGTTAVQQSEERHEKDKGD